MSDSDSIATEPGLAGISDYRRLLGQRVKVRQLVTALAIADHGSIAGASTALATAQPAISRTLQQLEQAIDIKLFDRRPRGMALTEEGALFLPHARSVATSLLQLERHVEHVKSGAAGSIRIGTVVAGSADLIPLAIARFSATRPHVRFAVVESAPDLLYASLLSGDLDLVIGRLMPLAEREHVDAEPFYQGSVHVLVRSEHPLATKRRVSLSSLVDETWILPPTTTALRTQIDQRFEATAGRLPRQVIESSTMPTVRRLLIETDSIAVVPAGALGSDTTSGSLLIRLDVALRIQPVPIGAITRSGVPLSRACEEFLTIARMLGDPNT